MYSPENPLIYIVLTEFMSPILAVLLLASALVVHFSKLMEMKMVEWMTTGRETVVTSLWRRKGDVDLTPGEAGTAGQRHVADVRGAGGSHILECSMCRATNLFI